MTTKLSPRKELVLEHLTRFFRDPKLEPRTIAILLELEHTMEMGTLVETEEGRNPFWFSTLTAGKMHCCHPRAQLEDLLRQTVIPACELEGTVPSPREFLENCAKLGYLTPDNDGGLARRVTFRGNDRQMICFPWAIFHLLHILNYQERTP